MRRMSMSKRLAVGILGGGGGVSALQAMLNKFASSGPVGIWRDANDYGILQQVGDQVNVSVPLRQNTTTAPLGSATINTIWDPYYCRMMFVEDQNSAKVTQNGAGWVVQNDANHYGGSVNRSLTTGNYIEFAAPATTTRVGVVCLKTSNGGFTLVSIDTDNTLATSLPTAQQLVDAGTMAATCLVAGGGTLNPTDRILDNYAVVQTYRQRVLVADALTAGEHTIRFTVTGYKRAAAANAGFYLDGILYGSADTTIASSGVVPVLLRAIKTGGAVWEYALCYQPEGATYTDFLGNGHGWDFQAAITPYVDGVEQTLSTFQTVSGSLVRVVRTSVLRHPNIDAGATDCGNVTVEYLMQAPTGLDVNVDIDWLVAGKMGAAYVGMLSCDNDFDKGSNIGLTVDETLTDDDDSVNCNAKSEAAWMWDADANYGALFQSKNLLEAVNNWAQTPTSWLWIQDYSTGNPKSNKIYLTRVQTGSFETITEASSIRARNNYRFGYFPGGADAALARS